MNLKNIISIILLTLVWNISQSQEMLLGIWKDGRQTIRFFHHSPEEVSWKIDNGRTIVTPGNKTTYFTLEHGEIRISTADKVLARTSTAERMAGEVYNLKSLQPERKEERYDQGFKVNINGGSMSLIGVMKDFDGYVAGVIEAEAGKEQSLEYYKVQAVICRTYALSNKRRHEHEGFNLCDQVHCQVYHGMSRFNPEIVEAANITEGEVVVDSNMDLITATFHSNCGGRTVNSEEVWTTALPYLRARTDTFCLNGNHATWESEILSSAWLEYLEEMTGDLSKVPRKKLYSFEQPERSTHIRLSDQTIPLKEIRSKWFLNSTFFDVDQKGDKLILRGKGFGHGVGLCQEGAMNMANKGYSYQDVLTFYYTDVHLLHLSVIEFFKNN